MTTLLQQAIDLATAGKRDAAETLIRRVLDDNPNNEVAWLWLSGVSREVTVKREALQRVLQLNPDNALAREGLAQFGGEDTPAPEDTLEAETTASEPPAADIPTDAFADDMASVDSTPDKPVFDVLPGDFDFDLEEPPVFDIDLVNLEVPGETPDTDDDFFHADVPAIDVAPFVDNAEPPAEPISERLEHMFAATETGEIAAPDAEADTDVSDAPDILPDELTAPAPALPADMTADDKPDSQEPEDIHKVLKERRRRQNRLLLAAAAFFAVVVLGSCSLYYYVTEIADIYSLLPQLAQEKLTEKAGKPKQGVSEIRFQGFPASRATIHWTEDNNAATCQGGTVGLKIDFNNGDKPQLYSNRNCSEKSCTFEKDLTPGAITNVTVTYLCGKDAVITLHK